MPLSKVGKEILKNFEKEYGKKKGEGIFYAWENKHKNLVLKDKKKARKYNDEYWSSW